MLSVIIPSYKDKYMVNTVQSILDNFVDEFEVIVVLDGYWPEFEIINDDRVRYVHLGSNRGMRGAINAGVRVARGEFLMRTDEHCMFAKGFDREMTDNCQDNWIMTATRYFLDPIKWEVIKELKPYVYEKLKIREIDGKEYKFEGVKWGERERQRKDIMIDETMAMQGSCWVMPHKWWDDVIGELQTEGYGPLIQDSTEMIFKTWKAGGKMMVNKNTWFAHKHVSFTRTHQQGTKENPAKNEDGYQYALEQWRDYYLKEIVPKWKI